MLLRSSHVIKILIVDPAIYLFPFHPSIFDQIYLENRFFSPVTEIYFNLVDFIIALLLERAKIYTILN